MKRIITGFMLAVIMSLALTACGNNSKIIVVPVRIERILVQ